MLKHYYNCSLNLIQCFTGFVQTENNFSFAYIPTHSLSFSLEFQKYLTVLYILALRIKNDMKRIHD